ncbi:MAG: M20/M25/M40 family metallo-hydrolase [Gemmatimonadetes bacterium]|nr:M20/M25/M40 family metallo-hydrolase [Gemmatimonadota bacterium]
MRDTSFEQAIAFARDLIRIPGLPGEEGEVAQRTRAEMESLGYDEVWTDDVGNVIGRIRGRGGPAVMLSCHLDAVDVGDMASWAHPPFAGDIADGFLHGRGAMDIKGPLALQTYAAAAFLDERPAGDVLVAHTVLEERGGWGMEHLLESRAVAPAVVIIGESTAGDICVGHRGRAELTVEIRGVAGHASAPDRASNPLSRAGEVLAAIQRFADGLESDPALGASTLAPTSVETLPRSRNVIPDRVRVILDWRVLPEMRAEEVAGRLERFLRAEVALPEPYALEVQHGVERQRTWTGVEEDRRLFTPGFLLPADHAITRAAVDAIRAAESRTPAVRPWTFATDGGHTCGVHGIPTIGYAPGEERYAHTNRERLDLAEAERAYRTYPRLIDAVMDAAGLP